MPVKNIYSNSDCWYIEYMGNNIRQLRDKLGLTQTQLANNIGVTKITVYKHESGRLGLKHELINKYAKALGCNPSDIITSATESRITEVNIELLENVTSNVMNFLIKNDYLNKLTSKQIARFITDVYVIIRDERKENKEFNIDESHLKILYRQVSNA